jgi:hypothetical protein
VGSRAGGRAGLTVRGCVLMERSGCGGVEGRVARALEGGSRGSKVLKVISEGVLRLRFESLEG